jgi:hypothetical protein
MHLHDRHGAHLTLPAPLKQAGQSLGRWLNGLISAGFPYTRSVSVNPRGFRRYFVSISLHGVTIIFRIGFSVGRLQIDDRKLPKEKAELVFVFY